MNKETKRAIDEWLGEIEVFSTRSERLPEGNVAEWMPWLHAAAEIGAKAAGMTVSKADLGQLRHAYEHLSAEMVVRQKEFADGLLAPIIRKLEAQSSGG